MASLFVLHFMIFYNEKKNVSLPINVSCIMLSISDMTFIFEGNKTIIDGLINFEKMVGT